MKGFLYRDLCGVKRIGKFVALIAVVFGIVGVVGTAHTMQILLPIYCILMCVNQLVEQDERSGWMAFASAVPDGRREMVRSKYIILLLMAEVSLPAEYTFGHRDGAFFSILVAAVLIPAAGAAAYKGMQACDWDLQGLNILVIVPIAAAAFLRPSYRASLSACKRREF